MNEDRKQDALDVMLLAVSLVIGAAIGLSLMALAMKLMALAMNLAARVLLGW